VVHYLELGKTLVRLLERERPLNRRKRKMPPTQMHLGKHAYRILATSDTLTPF